MAPAAASVLRMESAYFKVAATSSPPTAPSTDTSSVIIVQFAPNLTLSTFTTFQIPQRHYIQFLTDWGRPDYRLGSRRR